MLFIILSGYLLTVSKEQWERDSAEGKQDPLQWASFKDLKKGVWAPGRPSDKRVRCKDGLAVVEEGNANQTFRCKNVSICKSCLASSFVLTRTRWTSTTS